MNFIRILKQTMNKVCIISITASHYRKSIYKMMEELLGCSFIFGIDESSVKRLDTSILSHSIDIKNSYIGNTNWYTQKGLIRLTKDFDTIINDLGIFCLSAWWLLIVSKFRKKKIYHWDHGWYGREGFVKKWIKRLYFGLSDGAFIYGNYARDLMIKNGFEANKLHVIHNSLDYDKQLIIRRKLISSDIYQKHFSNNNPVICFIGRLTEVKRLDILLEAVSVLRKRGEDYNIVLIGDGEMRDSLTQKIRLLDLTKKVWLYGACYNEEENANLIYNADLCVAPGNIGLTAMHAMTFGCPCITHNDFPWQMPEFEAIKEGVTGAFFEHNNVNSLADTISNWFKSHKDDRENVRKACYKEIAENWTPEYQINILKKVINA